MRQWNRILAAVTAVLLLCMLGGGIALGVSGLPRTAPGPVYAAVHWTLWAVLLVGSAVCLAQLRRPGFRDDLRRLRGLLLAAACTSAGVRILDFVQNVLELKSSPYSAAEEVKHSILYMLFSYQGLLPHLVLMALIVLAVSLLPVQEEA